MTPERLFAVKLEKQKVEQLIDRLIHCAMELGKDQECVAMGYSSFADKVKADEDNLIDSRIKLSSYIELAIND